MSPAYKVCAPGWGESWEGKGLRTTHQATSPHPALAAQAPSPSQTGRVGEGAGKASAEEPAPQTTSGTCLSQTPPRPLAFLSQPGKVQYFFESNCKSLSSEKIKNSTWVPTSPPTP